MKIDAIRILAVAAVALIAGTTATRAESVSIDRLNAFFETDQSYFAEFYQVVLDEGLHLIEETSGLMWLERPNLFRWEYAEPLPQTIVSDGQSVWIYDQELRQATVQNYADVVGQSAAQILAGVDNLKQDYDVEDFGLQGELAWVSITPKDIEQAQFDIVRLGFDERTLKSIEILDTFSNTTRLTLYDAVVNSEFSEQTFRFEVPPEVDVIYTRE